MKLKITAKKYKYAILIDITPEKDESEKTLQEKHLQQANIKSSCTPVI